MGQRTMPAQRRGQSVQSVGTPAEFLDAVKRRLGIFAFGLDIAADKRNTVAKRFFTKADDCFAQASWKSTDRTGRPAWSWLNPEFDNIGPYAQRCLIEREINAAQIALLVPSSTGANWWREFVYRRAFILYLNGRIKFVGHEHAYPKDLALVLYSPIIAPGDDCWRWQG